MLKNALFIDFYFKVLFSSSSLMLESNLRLTDDQTLNQNEGIDYANQSLQQTKKRAKPTMSISDYDY